MDRISHTWLIAISLILSGCYQTGLQQNPEMILGTEEDQYRLFTPEQVASATGVPEPSDTTPIIEGTGTAGVSKDYSRGDHVHPESSAADLSDNTPKVAAGSGAAGSGGEASRDDHVHPAQALRTLSDQDPQEDGTAAAGTRTDVSRSDHVHPASLVQGQANTFTLFEQRNLTNPNQTLHLAANNAVTLALLAEETFSDGVHTGPFFTSYEGGIDFTPTTTGGAVLALTFEVTHTFSDSKQLLTTREIKRRIPAAGITIPINSFSGITDLQHGEVKATDGSTITITDALLAEPVKIAISLQIESTTMEVIDIEGVDDKVTFYQLASSSTEAVAATSTPVQVGNAAVVGDDDTWARGDHAHALNTTTFPGATLQLANRNPLGDGSAKPGTRGDVSRSDHVHPLFFETGLPKADGTANAGTSSDASRGDHVHPITPWSTSAAHTAFTASAGTAATVSRGDHVHADHVPNYTGQGGKCLKANSAGTSLEYGDCTGGSSGGGGSQWSVLMSTTRTADPYTGKDVVGFSPTSQQNAAMVALAKQGVMFAMTYIPNPASGTVSFVPSCSAFVKIEESNTGFNIFVPMQGSTDTGYVGYCRFTNSGPSIWITGAHSNTIPTGAISTLWYLELGGGGGGGDGPSIPDPTGTGNFLRVDSAGNAYELGKLANGDFNNTLASAIVNTAAPIPNDFTSKDYRLKIKSANTFEWSDDFQQDFEDNAGDIGNNSERIDSILIPQENKDSSTHKNGDVLTLHNCEVIADTDLKCSAAYAAPLSLNKTTILDNHAATSSAWGNGVALSDEQHTAMRNVLESDDPYRYFEIHAEYPRTNAAGYFYARIEGVSVNPLGSSRDFYGAGTSYYRIQGIGSGLLHSWIASLRGTGGTKVYLGNCSSCTGSESWKVTLVGVR